MLTKLGKGPPHGVVAALLPPPRPVNTASSRRRSPDQVLLSTYVPPYERIHHPAGMVTPNLEGVREIIHR